MHPLKLGDHSDMDKAMKKSSRIRSTLKLVLSSVIALSASPIFANETCPEGTLETRIGNSMYSRKITFQGNEYDCTKPGPSYVQGGGYSLNEKCGPFHAVYFNNTQSIVMQSKDRDWYEFRLVYDHDYIMNRKYKSTSNCNSTNTYCDVYTSSNNPELFRNENIRDPIAVHIIVVDQHKCIKSPTF